ncbi:hypothetical protein [Actinomadura kijaniata]|uniref:hypothetical protein n=1 Tax=Actinomadura kijaniata TaxID=46161 RepID=UPI000B015FD5|nr:hypothetical protein [Actinomadura kijaniata]
MTSFASGPTGRKLTLALLTSALALTGCSGKDEKKPSRPQATSAVPTPAPQPSYSTEQVEQRLLSPKEIGPNVREIRAVADVTKDGRAPMCSLSGAKLPGSPKTVTRQFNNATRGKGEIAYVQTIALYGSPDEAKKAYVALQDKAESCPAKRNVAAKRIRENFTLFSHKDTWKFDTGNVGNWVHGRGTERQQYPSATSKYNILHLMYDYASYGNLLVSSIYYERTEPKESGDPTSRRATEVLKKQLQKLG